MTCVIMLDNVMEKNGVAFLQTFLFQSRLTSLNLAFDITTLFFFFKNKINVQNKKGAFRQREIL